MLFRCKEAALLQHKFSGSLTAALKAVKEFRLSNEKPPKRFQKRFSARNIFFPNPRVLFDYNITITHRPRYALSTATRRPCFGYFLNFMRLN